uniref:Uncharacterized protein n=1 Tax=Arundo donax TaxID=35708 RepID=A0A0A8Y693_ARUDO
MTPSQPLSSTINNRDVYTRVQYFYVRSLEFRGGFFSVQIFAFKKGRNDLCQWLSVDQQPEFSNRIVIGLEYCL